MTTHAHSVSVALFLCSPAPADTQEAEPADAPDIQPFCLEEERPLPSPPCRAPQPDQSQNTDPAAPSPGQSEPARNLIELETTEESNSKTREVRGHAHKYTQLYCTSMCRFCLFVSLQL